MAKTLGHGGEAWGITCPPPRSIHPREGNQPNEETRRATTPAEREPRVGSLQQQPRWPGSHADFGQSYANVWESYADFRELDPRQLLLDAGQPSPDLTNVEDGALRFGLLRAVAVHFLFCLD